ncbi:MAG TPA: hypothetical protein VMT16_17115 [Thermoanaerobaculia bacterium]|nr:hypothetical protein [Thermoanaerobaculia bacterium]
MRGRRLRRVLLVAGLLVGIAAVSLGLLATRSWESPALTRAVLAALSGDDVQVGASRVRLSPLRGVELSGVTLDAGLPDGRLRATAEEARLAHRPLRLLAGEILVDEIVLRRPDAEVVWDEAAAPRQGAAAATPEGTEGAADEAAAAAREEPPWELSVRVERVAVVDGRLVMRERGVAEEMVRLEGIDVELREVAVPPGAAPALERLTARGKLAAERLATPALASRGVRGALRFAAGHLLVDDLELPTDYGPATVERLDLDLTRDPYVYALRGVATPLDTSRLLAAEAGFGDGALRFTLAGDGSEDGALRGDGALEVAAGTLGALPLLAAIERLIAGTDLVGRPYAPFTIPFTLAGDRLILAPFTVESGALRLGGSGLVDLAGPLDLRLEIALPREEVRVEEIPREVLAALTDVDGRVKLPLVVAGSLEAPRVAFDRSSWAGIARRRLADEAGRRLGEALRQRLRDDG